MESLQKLLNDEKQSLGNIKDYTRRKAWLQQDTSCVNEIVHHQEPLWRHLIVQWCYAVADLIEANREIVYIAIHILDTHITKLLSKNKNVQTIQSKKQYEIMVKASFLLSVRLYSSDHLPLTVQALVEKSSLAISSTELTSSAKDIYTSLSWHATVPTATRFVQALVQNLPDSISQDEKADIFNDAVYQVEMSVFDEFLMNYPPPSFVACMILENILCDRKVLSVSEHKRFRDEISSLTGYKQNFSIRQRLQNLQSCHASGTNCASITHIIPSDTSSKAASPLQTIQGRVQGVHQIDDNATSDTRSETASPLQSVQEQSKTDYSDDTNEAATLSKSKFACSISNNKRRSNVMISEDYTSAKKKQKL